MSQIIVNNLTYTQNINGIKTVQFNYLGNKVYSATQIDRIYGVFLSTPIIASSKFLKWNNFSWEGERLNGTEIFIYARASTSESDLESAIWNGPYLNENGDISDIGGGAYLQFLLILRNNGNNTPRIDSFNIGYLSSEDAIRFFTRSFEINFVPQHILLSYNATTSESDIIRFAISGEDTADTTTYQYIEPNKIEKLNEISFNSKYAKFMVELISSTNVPAVVHEFAVMFSGEDDKVIRINKKYMESSSSSFSTSSSSSFSSSSSSVDSSSSSSSVSSSSSSLDSSSSTSSSSSFDSSSHSSSSSIDSSSSSEIQNFSSSSTSTSSRSSQSSLSSSSRSSESYSSSTSSM